MSSPMTDQDVMIESLAKHAPITQHKNFSKHEASYRDFAAFLVVEQAIKSARTLPASIEQPDTSTITKIGIVGAGVAGLYAAMILQSLQIDFEILEANDRIGGRVFTHRFDDKGLSAEADDPARYDYFDVGAMRFPDIPFMKRVWDLFRRLQIEDRLIEYKFSAQNNLLYFNSAPPVNPSLPNSNDERDPFRVSISNGGDVPNHFVNGLDSVNNWIGKVYAYWRELFAPLDDDTSDEERRRIFAHAWSALRKQDHHTTRSIMREGQIDTKDHHGKVVERVPKYPNEVVDWLETFDTGTGIFNLSFIESVMDSLDFDWPYAATGNAGWVKPQTWVTIDGGCDHIPRAMADQLRAEPSKLLLDRRVTMMEKKGDDIAVTVAGEDKPRIYSQVISTVPLGCLAGIDLKDCALSYSQKLAIRSLQMMASTKIGIKFATRWWQDAEIMNGAPIMGGQSTTDLPIRCCVYPSYGLQCQYAPGVLLVSYSWSQDALRLGALASGSEKDRDELLRLTLDNLSRLHGISQDRFGDVVDYFVHNFYADPHARGAFAQFGPGQFGSGEDHYSLFASLKAPAAQGKLHIAGEATSVHHGWVLGALNSAWRAVYNALHGNEAKQRELIEKWSIPDEENEVHLREIAKLAMGGQI